MTDDAVVYFSRDRKERITQRECRLRYRIEVLHHLGSGYTKWTVQSYARFKWIARIQAWAYSDIGDTRVIDQRR